VNLTFWGAAGEVTGSCYLLETEHARVMIDCGLHQGEKESERLNRRLPWKNSMHLDAVVLTHAHLDHAGRLPQINDLPGSWSIHTTPATVALSDILLQDSARLQEMDAERESRRRQRQGKAMVRPLYTVRDVAITMQRFSPLAYDETREIAPGISIRFVDAGHILGSASVEMIVREGDERRTIVFSGDIGVPGSPLLRDPTPLKKADVLLLESTYGDRDHRPLSSTLDELTEILLEAERDQEKVLIPAFAIGRTQNLIYHISQLRREGRIKALPVFIDSPMGIAATELYSRSSDIFDEDSRKILARGKDLLSFPGLKFTLTADESRALNEHKGAAVIIAGSGMCTGGRIVHHLRHNLWRAGVHVVFVGFQGGGTLGRRLIERPSSVRIFGEPVAVKATIHTLGGLSAHAGQSTLVKWASSIRSPGGSSGGGKPRVFLTHGEDEPRAALAKRLRKDLGWVCERPTLGETLEL
jgi:metallo-beta-lactamase family protein